MLKVNNLSKSLGDFSMRNVSFEVSQGDYFVLLGASGVGKTILLETLSGILFPDSGTITLNGVDITNYKMQHRKLALVYQDQALFPHLSVRDNISYGLKYRGFSKRDIGNKVDLLCNQIAISHLQTRKPSTLSGGEAQRVALARALAIEPTCLLLDEPISSLDTGSRIDMRALLRTLNRKGITIIHVTHDYEEALSLANRIGIMEHGSIVQVDTPHNIFKHPKTEFIAHFVGIKNFFKGDVVKFYTKPDLSIDFSTGSLAFHVLTDTTAKSGNIIIRSEDIIVSTHPPSSSARNTYKGTIIDLCSVRLGVELSIDIGEEVVAHITNESVVSLDLSIGKEVYLQIKASAIRFLPA